MPYLDELTYTEIQSHESFSDQPSGMLNVNQLIQTEPPWVVQGTSTKKQKKLILADWTARNWSEAQITKVCAALLNLIDQGFTVYRYESGQIKPLLKENLPLLQTKAIRSELTPQNPDEIAKLAMAQHHLTRNEIQVLDHYWLQRVLGEQEDLTLHSLRLSDFVSLGEKNQQKLLEIMKQSNQRVEYLIQDAFSVKHNQAFHRLEALFPGVRTVQSSQHIVLTDKEITNLLSVGSCTLEKITLTPEQIKNIQTLDLKIPALDWGQLFKLLEITPHIKTLNLFSQKLKSAINAMPKLEALETLETLNLDQMQITPEALQTMLNSTPKLKTLKLFWCSIAKGDFNISEPLSELEVIDLNCANRFLDPRLKESILNNLIKNAPNIKKLLCQGLTISVPEGGFKELEEIHGDLLSPDLQNLMNHSPKLKILHYNLELDTAVKKGGFKHLEQVEHKGPNKIKASSLQSLLHGAPNIRQLNLSNILSMNGDLVLEESSLNNLEKITLDHNLIVPRILTTLLKAAPNLKTLRMCFCKLAYPEDIFLNQRAHLNKNRIEEIELIGTEISPKSLHFLFSITPNLKILITEVATLEQLKKPELNNLEVLDLYIKVDTTPATIISILKMTPNLKTLKLRHGTLTKDEIQSIRANSPHLNIELYDNTEKKPIVAPSNTVQPVDQQYSPAAFKDLKPPSEESVFQFKGQNKTKNQGMIIEKFCQYLTLKQKHLASIPKLQGGICNALTHYFLSLEQVPGQGSQFIKEVALWEGDKSSLTPTLEASFDALWPYIETYQLNTANEIRQCFGDMYLIHRLKALPLPQQGYILSNPWHAITIKKDIKTKLWLVYDPNFVNGPKEVSEQELPNTIKQAIGSLINVKTNQALWIPHIENPQRFFEEGGLLVLINSANAAQMLKQLPANTDYSKAALEGLFFRDLRGVPAWVRGLKNPTTEQITYTLLNQFIKKNPTTYAKSIQKSIELLTPQQKQECISFLIATNAKASSPQASAAPDDLITVIRTTPNTEHYEKRLQTWRTPKTETPSLTEYCQQCMQPDGVKKRLIQLKSSSQVDSMHFALEHYAKSTKRPVFYVNSARDLICSAPIVKPDPKNPLRGALQKGPGGPLYDFLQAHQKGQPAPVIIVNYDAFKDEDLIRFNSLLDEQRRADGTLVPEHALVIGLINTNKPNCYQGSDFYSRFDKREPCPVPDKTLEQAIPALPFIKQTADKSIKTSPINLFHDNQWKNRLLGRWTLEGTHLVFKEGELVSALAKKLPIEIQNGLWEDKEFQNFWRQALQRGVIEHAGRTIVIPPGTQLMPTEGYDWNALKTILVAKTHAQTDKPDILNPQLLNDFFSHDAYSQTSKSMTNKPGLIENAKGTSLKVTLTHQLHLDQWARLLLECQNHRVTLQVECATGVDLPKELHAPQAAVTPPLSVWKSTEALSTTQIINSTDVDTTVAMLTTFNDTTKWQVIDVSECTPSDLLERLDGSFNSQTLSFEFQHSLGALNQALKNKTPIILKGRFSAELEQKLATLLIARQGQAGLSPLILISDNPKSFQYVPTQTHKVSAEEQALCLFKNKVNATLRRQIHPFMGKEPLSTLRARFDYYQANPASTTPNVPWRGLNEVPGTPKPLAALNVNTSEQEAAAFHQGRVEAVNKVIKSEPYVFLAGFSGVGKSTFVSQYLSKKPNTLHTLDQDTQKQKINAIMIAWAKEHNTKGYSTLFVDEATLSVSDWSIFEGLYNDPPSILIDGIVWPLTANHKVVFAGNPVSYGDERKLATFFQRHGNALVFEPLPTAVLYEDILKPVFAKTIQEASSASLSQPFIEVYRFLVACSTKDVLISPRELQMMALLTLSYCQNNPTANKDQVARHYAYKLAKNLVPQEKQAEFDQKFKPKATWPMKVDLNKQAFLLTPSREPIAQHLEDLLALRQVRRNASGDAQKYGGLGGLILDGEPGVGKSELVLAVLRAKGYQEVHDFHGIPNVQIPDKPFYRMPVSMQLDDKKKLLLKAFHEGAVVVIDEINTSPMMERFMNALLMGQTPDGKRPNKPGFLIIGTQNPVTMAGRRAPSTALSRRLITELLPTYPEKELQDILMSKGVPTAQAKELVIAFNKNVEYAKAHYLSPPPSFRDVLHLVGDIAPTVKLNTNATHDFKNRLNATIERSSDSQDPLPIPSIK